MQPCNQDYFSIEPPSAASLIVFPQNFKIFTLKIFPLSQPSNCILHYNITPMVSDGSVLPDISLDPPSSGTSIATALGGFDSCNNSYSFTVVAITRNGPGERSAVFPAPPFKLPSKLLANPSMMSGSSGF